MRMRVADQCALRFTGKYNIVSDFCLFFKGNLQHYRFIFTVYYQGRKVTSSFW